ncbi:MAG: lipid A biosynthesis lauroyl acyltransferase [Pseudomonadota bacterium]|nr:MAG: lipid A biosynthesis lauroyl acyltransferase [Pseudomonadota bacterium]
MSRVKHGLTTLLLGLARGLGRLPPTAARWLVRPLAPLLRLAMRRRRRIAERNLVLCFPELDDSARRWLLRLHFRNLTEMVAEMSMAWSRPGRLDRRFGAVEGLANLHAARENGGVLLITGHATCLELAGRLVAERVELAGVYRPLSNSAIERFQNRGRSRYTIAMFPRHRLRDMIRHLRAGGVLWYAPDQDFGPERSVFAPFFGHQTATARAILDLARLGRARVVPMYPVKDEQSGRLTIHVEPAFDHFPGDDAVTDLGRFNAFLERWIRQAPGQYYWVHRRFKTTPAGVPSRYPEC